MKTATAVVDGCCRHGGIDVQQLAESGNIACRRASLAQTVIPVVELRTEKLRPTAGDEGVVYGGPRTVKTCAFYRSSRRINKTHETDGDLDEAIYSSLSLHEESRFPRSPGTSNGTRD